MDPARRRTLLFLLSAVVLLATGYAWGSTTAYNRFYSPDASLDRELVHLDFNNRVLHYVNVGQRDACRRELVTQLTQEVAYVKALQSGASTDARTDADRKLRRAERVIAGQPLNAAASLTASPEKPPAPPDRP